ncbi:MAG: hypothetical protein E7569_05580 [Ruminococcaceae bacterium]|nr:hypothetical protein [Oscillospiraceae bacterium]
MGYAVVSTPKFEEDIKFYIKKRKYKHIDDDLNIVIEQLELGNFLGDSITDINANNKTYKVRAANSDTCVGRSNGYRLVYYAISEELTIYLLTVYYKKDDGRIPSKSEIKEIIEQYCN